MKKLNLSIFLKIWLSISVLIMGYVISMILIQTTGGKIKTRLNVVTETLFPAAAMSQNAVATFEKQTKLYQDAVMMGEASLVEKAADESKRVVSFLGDTCALGGLNPDRLNTVEKLKKSIEVFTGDSTAIYSKMASGEMGQAMIDKAGEQSKAKDALLESLSGLAKQFSGDLKDEIQSIIDFYAGQQRFNLILFVIVLLVSLTVVWMVIKRSIIHPVNGVINRLKQVTPEIDQASSQVSASSQSLAEGSSEQAASIEETSSSLEEMSSMTKQNADHASEANNLMKEAGKVIDKANRSMTELTDSMSKISRASEETSKIIKTIDEIAFQTNLLALNAAVEAARAGEAGAGFAVVADEVRNLAMRAADAAKNTAGLIEDTVKRIQNGTKVVAETNSAFAEVSKASVTIGELVGEIAAASKEQAQGIEQINKAVVEMDKVVQQNAASAEESASASQEMNAQAEYLKLVVTDLIGIIGGSGSNGGSGGNGKSLADLPYQSRQKPAKTAISLVPGLTIVKKNSGLTRFKAKVINPDEVIPMDEADLNEF
jgi:methyl-accepting chemotaxis protein